MKRWDRDDGARSGGAKGTAAEGAGVQDASMAGQDGSTLLLRTSGNLLESRSPSSARVALNGLMRVIRNYPQRSKEWAFSCSCANERTGEMALADERGQVYVLSPAGNTYRSVRLASSPVSCLGFVTSRTGELIIAYENGAVLVIDTEKKEIVGNLRSQGSSPIRLIRAHPSKPAVLLVSDERVVSFWSLAKMRCTKEIESEEPVVDLRFESGGAIIAMTLLESGLFLHRASDFTLLQRCPLPSAERKPARWLAYASHSLVVPTAAASSADAPPPPGPQQGKPKGAAGGGDGQSDFQVRVLLSADNGMLYVWDAAVPRASLSASAGAGAGAGGNGPTKEARPAALVGVVELPVTMRAAVALVPLAHVRHSVHQARLLVLSDAADLALVEVEGASQLSLGTWAVTMAMSAGLLLGVGSGGSGGQQPVLPGFAVGLQGEGGEGADAGAEGSDKGRGSGRNALGGLLSAQGNLFIAIGRDKAARLFDADPALGLGELSGTALRCRLPHAALAKRPDYWSQIQDMKASHAHAAGSTSASASASASARKSYAAMQVGAGAAATGMSFPWAGAGARVRGSVDSAGQRSGSAAGDDEDDLGPPPPYLSSSINSTGMAAIRAGAAAAASASASGSGSSSSGSGSGSSSSGSGSGSGSSGSGSGSGSSGSSSSLQPGAGGDSPKGPSRQPRTTPSATEAGDRGVQREMARQQKARDDRAAQEEAAAEMARLEQLKAHRQAVGQARLARDAERAARAAAKAEAAAARREAKLARQAQLQAQGISARASELFELAALSPAERDANVKKLRGFLDVHGEFPAKYRNLIWRFLLQLPENVSAFGELRDKGVHPGYAHLPQSYPLPDAALSSRLQALCSQLSHWSPVLSEAKFLPQLVFPFVVQFGADDLAAFETAASIMMWWGHTWLTSFPTDPIHIVDTIDALVATHDSKLRYHFSRVKGVSAGQLGWAMMSTGFSEVLCKADWLRLMDFLFASFRHPGYFLLAPVAILRNVRTSLATTDRAEVLELFCHRLQGIDVAAVISDIKSMFHETPAAKLAVLVPKRLTESGDIVHYASDPQDQNQGRGDDESKRPGGEDDDFSDDEDDYGDEGVRQMRALEANEAKELDREGGVKEAKAKGSAVFPLPKAVAYPRYDCYPTHVLDWQLRERSHQNALLRELHRKEHILRALTVKTTEVRAEHEAWLARHGHAADAEAKRRVATMEAEVAHMKELLKMEELISAQRVDALVMLEKVAEEELTVLDTATEQARELIQVSEAHLQEKANLALSLARHRELAEEAEATTEDRIRTLQLRRSRDERLKSLSSTIKAKEQELDARDALLVEQWKRQDDDAARRRADRAQKAKSLLEEEILGDLQEEMGARMRRLVLEREAKLVELERGRALRLAKEKTDEAIEAAERSALLMQKQELAAATEKAAQLASAGHKMTQDLLMTTVDQIRAESSRLVEAEQVYALRQHKARLAAQSAGMEREWAEKKTKIMVGVLSSEQELQEQRLRLSRASAETEAEESLILEQQRVFADLQKEGAGAPLEALGERVMRQQRERFEEMRKALSSGPDGPRMQAQGIISTLDAAIGSDARASADDTARRASARSAMSGDSLQALLRDKKERHERERRVAALLGKTVLGGAAPEGLVETVVDDDPTLWSFR